MPTRSCPANGDFHLWGSIFVHEVWILLRQRQGLLQDAYRLTARGAEVCDSILADLL